MKKYIITSCVYMAIGLAFGVFFREFTKFFEYTGATALGKLHLHSLVLGTVFFLLVALFESKLGLRKSKLERWFFAVYNAGMGVFLCMLLVRGVLQVSGADLSSGANGAISGVAGIGHALLAAGLVLFFVMLLKNCKAASAGAAARDEDEKNAA